MIWRIARRRHNIVFVFGKQAKVLREMLDSAVVPDRTALEKEADEFALSHLKETMEKYREVCRNKNSNSTIKRRNLAIGSNC